MLVGRVGVRQESQSPRVEEVCDVKILHVNLKLIFTIGRIVNDTPDIWGSWHGLCMRVPKQFHVDKLHSAQRCNGSCFIPGKNRCRVQFCCIISLIDLYADIYIA